MKTIQALLLCLMVGCAVESNNLAPLDGSSEGHILPRRGPSTLPDASPLDTAQTEVAIDLNVEKNTTGLSLDSTTDSERVDLLKIDGSPDLPPVSQPDAQPDRMPSRDLPPPDLLTNLPLGTLCSHNTDCRSSFCTDGVCCEVAKCTNTCDPTFPTCTPYNGFTCAPYGTCRGY